MLAVYRQRAMARESLPSVSCVVGKMQQQRCCCSSTSHLQQKYDSASIATRRVVQSREATSGLPLQQQQSSLHYHHHHIDSRIYLQRRSIIRATFSTSSSQTSTSRPPIKQQHRHQQQQRQQLPIAAFVDLDNVAPKTHRRNDIKKFISPIVELERLVNNSISNNRISSSSSTSKKKKSNNIHIEAFGNLATRSFRGEEEREHILEDQEYIPWPDGGDITWNPALHDDPLDAIFDDDFDHMAQTGYDADDILRCGVCGAKMKLTKKDKKSGWTLHDKLQQHMKLHDREQNKRKSYMVMKQNKRKKKGLGGQKGLSLMSEKDRVKYQKYEAAQVGLKKSKTTVDKSGKVKSTSTPRNDLFQILRELGVKVKSRDDVDRALIGAADSWMNKVVKNELGRNLAKRIMNDDTNSDDPRGVLIVYSKDSDFRPLLQRAKQKGFVTVSMSNENVQTSKLLVSSDIVIKPFANWSAGSHEESGDALKTGANKINWKSFLDEESGDAFGLDEVFDSDFDTQDDEFGDMLELDEEFDQFDVDSDSQEDEFDDELELDEEFDSDFDSEEDEFDDMPVRVRLDEEYDSDSDTEEYECKNENDTDFLSLSKMKTVLEENGDDQQSNNDIQDDGYRIGQVDNALSSLSSSSSTSIEAVSISEEGYNFMIDRRGGQNGVDGDANARWTLADGPTEVVPKQSEPTLSSATQNRRQHMAGTQFKGKRKNRVKERATKSLAIDYDSFEQAVSDEFIQQYIPIERSTPDDAKEPSQPKKKKPLSPKKLAKKLKHEREEELRKEEDEKARKAVVEGLGLDLEDPDLPIQVTRNSVNVGGRMRSLKTYECKGCGVQIPNWKPFKEHVKRCDGGRGKPGKHPIPARKNIMQRFRAYRDPVEVIQEELERIDKEKKKEQQNECD